MLIINERLAELVGIILGDGSISEYVSSYGTHRRLQITFNSTQEPYIAYVRSLIEEVLLIRPLYKKRQKQKTADLHVFRKAVIEQLLLLGMQTSPKWQRAVVPRHFMNKEFGAYVLKGYFDTDGSVVITNNNGTRYPRLEMKISPSPMQKQLLHLLDLFGFRYKAYAIGKGKVRVQMNGLASLKKWNDQIGFSNEYYQQRCDSFFLD